VVIGKLHLTILLVGLFALLVALKFLLLARTHRPAAEVAALAVVAAVADALVAGAVNAHRLAELLRA
jgi:hypothetical protein